MTILWYFLGLFLGVEVSLLVSICSNPDHMLTRPPGPQGPRVLLQWPHRYRLDIPLLEHEGEYKHLEANSIFSLVCVLDLHLHPL